MCPATIEAPPERDIDKEFDDIVGKQFDDEDHDNHNCLLCATGKWRPCKCGGQIHNELKRVLKIGPEILMEKCYGPDPFGSLRPIGCGFQSRSRA